MMPQVCGGQKKWQSCAEVPSNTKERRQHMTNRLIVEIVEGMNLCNINTKILLLSLPSLYDQKGPC